MVDISKYSKGILGTLIFHLSIVLVFLAFKINSLDFSKEQEIVVDFAENEPELTDEEKKDMELAELAQFYDWYKNQSFSNKASNNNLKEELSTEKYEEMLKRELEQGRDPIDIPELDEGATLEPDKEEEKNEAFVGTTTISYDLGGRNSRYIPVPVYKCKGSGIVKVEIIVDQKGKTIGTRILEKESTASMCHFEEALKYAKRARFSYDFNAPLRQTGWIQYTFIAQ